MKQKLKQSKGITLVSLVVTIIVLIILAGISLALIFGENGIVGRAKEAKTVTSVATAQEKLELIKSKILLDKFEITLDDYLEELEKVKEEYQVDDIEKIDDKTAEIIVDGKYKFTITDEGNGNLKTDYKGEAGGIELSAIGGTYVYPTTGTFEVVKNISGGELSVKSENENIAKATISGTTVTVEPQNVAGTVKIIVTSAANGEYAEQKAVYKATVENGTITLSVDAYTGNYDGNDHDAVSNVKVTPTDATVEYSIDGGAFSSTIPKVNGANTYSVSIRASKAGYATKTITKTVTIGKNTQTGNLALSATSGTITYPTAGTFTVTKNASGGALSVTSSDTNVATATISGTTVTITPKAISADGKQTTITVTSAATSNYEKQTQTYTATVNRGTITLDATAYTGNYDGNDHDAVSNVKVTPIDATVEYSIDGGAFSSTIPKVNGANTYSVSIRASKAGYTTKTITKTITIGKNTQTGNLTLSATSGTITYPTAGTFTVTKNTSGGALSVTSSDTSVATVAISGTKVTITPKAISADGKQTTITVTSAATSNYEKQTKNYTATVNRGTITLDATAYTGNYDGSDHDAVSNVKVTPTDATVEYSIDGGTFSSTIPKVNGANTYSVSIRASKAGYTTKTITKTITIGKNTQTGNLTLSATSGTITYPTVGTFTVTKNTSGGTLSVTSSDTSVATAAISGTTVTITPKAISADGKQTTITVTSAATSNYEKQTQTYTATVNRGTISLDATAYTGSYDGSDHNAVSNVKVTPTDATVEYSIDGGTFSTTIPKVNGANTYSVSIRASKAGYATKTITKTVTIGKNTQTGNLALSATSGTITYPTAGTFTVTKNTSGGALSVTSSDTNVATASINGTTVIITPKAISSDGKQTTITVTSAATSNYEKQTQTYTATVNRGTISLDATAYTGTYDGSKHDAVSNVKVTPTDATVEYSIDGGAFSTTIPKVNGANTYSVSIRASKAGYATKVITKTITVKEITTTKELPTGVYINYDTGVSSVGTNGVVTCRVLYTESSQYGLQIITDKNIADVTLGGNDWDTGRDSYNNAIVTLNNEAGKYLNRAYAIDARCVGSVPTNQNGTFTNKNSENAGPVQLQFTSSVDGANNMKGEDTNDETDETQMFYLNIKKTGENYWIASRHVYSSSSFCSFFVCYVNSDGNVYFNGNYLCTVSSSNSGVTKGYSITNGIRPCFSLKSDIKITGGNGTSENPYTMEKRELTTNELTAGDYINYNTGVSGVGTNGVVTCRVLYDASSQYGLQIITDKNIANVTLGGSDWDTASDSYNNAITTLNSEAGKYLNRAYATDARCVGSVPTNQNGTFTNKNSENAGPVQLQFTSSASGANNMKGEDTNYETDQTQMKNLNIWTTGEYYWITSRRVRSDSSNCHFYVRDVSSGGNLRNNDVCIVNSSGRTNGILYPGGLRPCFALKSDIKITGGKGTSGNPYTM